MLPPDGTIGISRPQAPFLGPRNALYPPTQSADLGGIALNNPQQGLMVQGWYARVDTPVAGNIYISADNVPEILYVTLPGTTEISITFDQNMNTFLAFVQNGIARFRWFDTVSQSYTITTLEEGSISPRASLDDKRPQSSQQSDILLFYVVGNQLLYRMQRDRYGVIYVADAELGSRVAGPRIRDVGMNVVNRFQVFVQAAFTL